MVDYGLLNEPLIPESSDSDSPPPLVPAAPSPRPADPICPRCGQTLSAHPCPSPSSRDSSPPAAGKGKRASKGKPKGKRQGKNSDSKGDPFASADGSLTALPQHLPFSERRLIWRTADGMPLGGSTAEEHERVAAFLRGFGGLMSLQTLVALLNRWHEGEDLSWLSLIHI